MKGWNGLWGTDSETSLEGDSLISKQQVMQTVVRVDDEDTQANMVAYASICKDMIAYARIL